MMAPIIKKIDHGVCRGCGESVEPEKKTFGFPETQTTKKVQVVYLFMCCAECQAMDLAVAEAEEESRRYTLVGIGIDGRDFYNGSRCLCGAVTHAIRGTCIRCWRASRMLEKVDAENRLFSKMLKELRAEIRTQKKEIADQLT